MVIVTDTIRVPPHSQTEPLLLNAKFDFLDVPWTLILTRERKGQPFGDRAIGTS